MVITSTRPKGFVETYQGERPTELLHRLLAYGNEKQATCISELANDYFALSYSGLFQILLSMSASPSTWTELNHYHVNLNRL
jgi:hypothetical protein